MGIKKEINYFFIESKDVKRVSYEIKREFALNDFENVYYQTGYQELNDMFEQYGIPEEYRKLVFEMRGNIPPCSLFQKKINELFFDQIFVVRCTDYDENNSKLVYGTTDPYDLTKNMFFTANPVTTNLSEVLQFINELVSLGLMDNYLSAIYAFFARDEKEEKIVDQAILKKKIETLLN